MAANPAKDEALSEPATLTYDGETYTVDPAAEWDLEVLEAFEDEQIVRALRALLGPDQWAKFRSKKRVVSDLNDLWAEIQNALGIEGN